MGARRELPQKGDEARQIMSNACGGTCEANSKMRWAQRGAAIGPHDASTSPNASMAKGGPARARFRTKFTRFGLRLRPLVTTSPRCFLRARGKSELQGVGISSQFAGGTWPRVTNGDEAIDNATQKLVASVPLFVGIEIASRCRRA
jgi:hypothetical protein